MQETVSSLLEKAQLLEFALGTNGLSFPSVRLHESCDTSAHLRPLGAEASMTQDAQVTGQGQALVNNVALRGQRSH